MNQNSPIQGYLNNNTSNNEADLVQNLKTNYSNLNDKTLPFSIYYNEHEKLSQSHKKILSILKKYKFDAEFINILSHFFYLEDERQTSDGPSCHMVQYLHTISAEILDVLTQKSNKGGHKNKNHIELKLFQVFIRFNFNKESIYKYLVKKIDEILEANRKKEEETLRMLLIESGTPVRKDMAYNQKANSLAKDIRAELKKRNQYIHANNSFSWPITFTQSADVSMAVISALLDIGFLISPPKRKYLYNNIRENTRASNGRKYSFYSIRNGLRPAEEAHIESAQHELQKAIDRLSKVKEELGR